MSSRKFCFEFVKKYWLSISLKSLVLVMNPMAGSRRKDWERTYKFIVGVQVEIKFYERIYFTAGKKM